MSLKFALFVLLAISAQGFCHVHETKEIEPRDIGEELQKLLQELIEEVRGAIGSALERIKQLYDELAEETREKIQAALKDIEKLVAETKAELQKILEEAAQIGEEARKCVDAEMPNIEKLQQESAAAMQVCSKEILSDVREAKEVVETTIKKSIGAVKGLIDEFKACGNILCKIGVISKIQTTIATIRKDIATAVKEIKGIIAEAMPAAKKCVSDVVSSHIAESQAITNRVRECVNQIGGK